GELEPGLDAAGDGDVDDVAVEPLGLEAALHRLDERPQADLPRSGHASLPAAASPAADEGPTARGWSLFPPALRAGPCARARRGGHLLQPTSSSSWPSPSSFTLPTPLAKKYSLVDVGTPMITRER